MSPIKLVIIAILLYLGYRLLTSGKGKKNEKTDSAATDQNSGPVADVLVEDPVCHKLVPKQQAIRLQHKENIVYFCSESCCDKFVRLEGDKK